MTKDVSNQVKSFHVLYGSQTGQAQALAEGITEIAPSYGLKANTFCLSLIDKRFCIEKIPCAVIVVSTTGDGDPPDTAIKFFRRLNRTTLSHTYLENLNYALLALGDSNYIRFCNFGHELEKCLKTLSAKSFFPTGYGDDKVGLESSALPWIHKLWPVLREHLGLKSTEDIIGQESPFLPTDNPLSMAETMDALSLTDLSLLLKNCDVEKLRFPRLTPPSLLISYGEKTEGDQYSFVPSDALLSFQDSPLAKVKLTAARKLTSGEDVKTTLEMEFHFVDDNIPYLPGDSFGFICRNPVDEVDILLERLNILHRAELPVILQIPETLALKRKPPFHIPPHISLRDLFLYCVEIRVVPKKVLLRVLAEFASQEEDKVALLYLSSQEGSKAYAECIRTPSLSVLDILMHYKSCTPPVERLLEHFPSLKPRFYSVASSPLENKMSFKIVFNVLKMDATDGRFKEREGVCTGWLSKMAAGLISGSTEELNITEGMARLHLDTCQSSLLVYKRRNPYFLLPQIQNCPIILIGPGTGIAPFVGFLKHRERLLKMEETDSHTTKNSVWLFYGCRYDNRDFLYKTELQRLKSTGVLDHFIVSLSRETSPPPYVMSKYVHESIRQKADELVTAINAGASIFVCGDAKHMSHDVQKAFIDAFQTTGLSEAEAKSMVDELLKQHRYINDVWA